MLRLAYFQEFLMEFQDCDDIKFFLLRGDLPLISANSADALKHVKDAAERVLGLEILNIARSPATDYFTKNGDTLEVHYNFSAEVARNSAENLKGNWFDVGEMSPSFVTLNDWDALQNHWYFAKLRRTTRQEDKVEIGVRESDVERLNYLWERALKKCGALPYPS